RAGDHVAGVRLEVAAAERRPARLDEAPLAPLDDHHDAGAARAARGLQDEVRGRGEPVAEGADAPLRVAHVAQPGRRDAVRGERGLGGALVVGHAVVIARIVGEEVGVVAAVQAQHLGAQAAQASDHGAGGSARPGAAAGASASDRCSPTAPRKRTYSSRRSPRHLPSSTSTTTVASRISGKATAWRRRCWRARRSATPSPTMATKMSVPHQSPVVMKASETMTGPNMPKVSSPITTRATTTSEAMMGRIRIKVSAPSGT